MLSHFPMGRLSKSAVRMFCSAVLGLIVAVPLCPSESSAVTLRATWQPSPDSRTTGYKLHYGSSSGNYAKIIDASAQTTCTISDLQEAQTYFFAASAYDDAGNSSPLSQEASFAISANAAPVAANATLLVTEDLGSQGALPAADPEGSPLTFKIVGLPARGAVSLDNPSSGAFTYTPHGDATGSDSFTFRANDGRQDSNLGTVSVTINPVNDAPLTSPDTAKTIQNTMVSINVLSNDTDPEGEILSLVSASDGSQGSTVVSGTIIHYTPRSGFAGTDSFTYRIMDGQGATATGTVTVTISAMTNDPNTEEEESALLPQDGWTLRYVDSQELVGEDGAAENAFDGDPETLWHTQWQSADPKHPHEIQIDLGAAYEVSGFRYLPRQDGSANGRMRQYEFYVSSDGVNWGTPVVMGVFTNDPGEKEVTFPNQSACYIRLRALGEVNGNAWSSMAEIRLLGSTQQTSSLLPQDQWILKYCDSEEILGENAAATNAFDNDPHTFWHTLWYQSQTDPGHPHEVQIDVGGVYEISGFQYLPRQDGSQNGRIKQYEFYVSSDGVNWGTPVATGVFANDSSQKQVSFIPKVGSFIRLRALSEVNGNPWSSTAEIHLVGKAQRGVSKLPRDSWTLKYVDSQELVRENGAAKNAFDNNPNTFWHTQWYQASPNTPHEIQVNLGAIYEIQGFRYLPRQDGGVNGRIKQYEMYVSSDGVNWGSPTASGVFANDATEKQVSFAPKAGSFIRLRALAEVNGNPWTSMAELNLLGR